VVARGIAPQASKVVEGNKDDDECTNVVQYNSMGEVEGAGYRTAINKGYKVGMYLQLEPVKGSNTAEHSELVQWKVASIGDDGSFELTDVAADGKVVCDSKTTVGLEKIVELYRACKEKEFLANYPGIDASNDNELEKIEFKGMVASALMALKFAPPKVRIMMKPIRGVYALENFTYGQYVVAPMSRTIVVDPKKESGGASKAIRVGIKYDGAPAVFINPDMPSAEYASQFWAIRVVDNKAIANCEYEERTLSMRRATDKAKNANQVIEFVIPVICNVREIKQDEEIVVYKADTNCVPPAAKKRSVPMLLESKGKKAKSA
jgi:hypothetical protein